MTKQRRFREVKLSEDVMLDELPNVYWKDIDHYLDKMNLDRSAIISTIRIEVQKEEYWGEVEPYICAAFSTLETDVEYKRRLDDKARQEEHDRALYEELKAKFGD